MAWSRRLFNLMVGIALVQIVYYYPQMPDTLASHFDGLGAANDWSSKNGFFGLYLTLLVLLIGVFVWLPAWSQQRSNFGMKLPHRDFWLAPARIEATQRFFKRQLTIMGIVHLALMIYTVQLAIIANFAAQPRMHPSIVWALGGYFLFLLAWLVHFYWHFRKP